MTTDEGFREIQLNGKQLVFLFMAATVVSVVIFLCGVLVGRGVRPDRSVSPDMAASEIAPDPEMMASQAPAVPSASVEPPQPAEDLSYFERLQKEEPQQETLRPVSSDVPPPVSEQVPQAEAEPPSSRPSPPDARPAAMAGDPSGSGFAVQVAAYRDRREADTLVKRLVGKGYPAFVMTPVQGAPTTMYRVRVGKYKDKREAESVSRRLETEEQFKPWIAR